MTDPGCLFPPAPLFEKAGPYAEKVQCRVCGHKGYGPINARLGEAPPYIWQQKCLAGHPHRCSCGRLFANNYRIAAHLRSAKGFHRRVIPLRDARAVWGTFGIQDTIRNLVEIRTRAGIKQSDLARFMDITQSTLAGIEKGEDHRLSTVFRYARALGVDLDFKLVTDG